MELNPDQIQSLIEIVAQTKSQEFDCDEMVRALANFAEKNSDKNEKPDNSEIEHHLSICPDCKEEFEMMQSILNEGNLES